MRIIPFTLRKANEFVKQFHRHSKTVVGCKFSIAAVDENNKIIGIAIVGRPVARKMDDGLTGEIVRTCTDGSKNVNSFLYGACARIWKEMGGTRYHPGTHLRIVNEMAIAKYQNILGQKSIVCKPGTIGIFHSGLWHGAGVNFSENIRYMFKVRLQPTEKQELLWDPEKKYQPLPNRALYWTDESKDQTINDILMKPYPWQEADTNRLDKINVVKFWRLLTGHKKMDVDYWLTRIENELY